MFFYVMATQRGGRSDIDRVWVFLVVDLAALIEGFFGEGPGSLR